jgi:hypothetical protein
VLAAEYRQLQPATSGYQGRPGQSFEDPFSLLPQQFARPLHLYLEVVQTRLLLKIMMTNTMNTRLPSVLGWRIPGLRDKTITSLMWKLPESVSVNPARSEMNLC